LTFKHTFVMSASWFFAG